MKKSNSKKVYVAMSGGVDSSVTAWLLAEQGYDVTGVFMRNWHADIHDGFVGDCPWEKDWADVQAVCNKLNIPSKLWDFSQEYYQDVVSYFFREYEAGRTPNPDVMCNKYIKFGMFLAKALAAGVDYVATGHYARLHQKFPISNFQFTNKLPVKKLKLNKNYQLLTGSDDNKDQSYFLWTLTQGQLKHVLFPVGELAKPRVRELAKAAGLRTYSKRDSQGVCFIGRIDVQEFLRSRLPEKPGKVMTVEGREIGEHPGAYFYTQGQRHGLAIGGSVLPYYVKDKDVKKNTVTVVEGDEHPGLYSQNLTAKNINWISGHKPKLPIRCMARIRYRQELQKCVVNVADESSVIKVEFSKPQRAVSPGQSIVFYNKAVCLGGGIIEEAV